MGGNQLVIFNAVVGRRGWMSLQVERHPYKLAVFDDFAQHGLQNATVLIVLHLYRCIDATDGGKL
ncbi:MAG TPA: hypothetical protein DCZ03_06220 [Gammaproteobacteria bacterium]|nr:hypothetical protein [Gammaproteobacteria bacterium]